MENKKLTMTNEWDKIFPKSGKVNHRKITFHNRYGITLAADLYEPKGVTGRLAAIAASGPFGAVKEQAAGLYAQTMAERGFLTIAFGSVLSPVKAAASLVMWLHLTLTRKIFRQQLISFPYRKMLIRKESELSVSAAGAAWL